MLRAFPGNKARSAQRTILLFLSSVLLVTSLPLSSRLVKVLWFVEILDGFPLFSLESSFLKLLLLFFTVPYCLVADKTEEMKKKRATKQIISCISSGVLDS